MTASSTTWSGCRCGLPHPTLACQGFRLGADGVAAPAATSVGTSVTAQNVLSGPLRLDLLPASILRSARVEEVEERRYRCEQSDT